MAKVPPYTFDCELSNRHWLNCTLPPTWNHVPPLPTDFSEWKNIWLTVPPLDTAYTAPPCSVMGDAKGGSKWFVWNVPRCNVNVLPENQMAPPRPCAAARPVLLFANVQSVAVKLATFCTASAPPSVFAMLCWNWQWSKTTVGQFARKKAPPFCEDCPSWNVQPVIVAVVFVR